MFDTDNLVYWLVGLLAAAGVVVWLRSHFSPEARERRRWNRSRGRVVSRRHGPSVRLSVKTEKPKRDQER